MAMLDDRVALLEQAQERNATREIGGSLSLIQAFSASSGAAFDAVTSMGSVIIFPGAP